MRITIIGCGRLGLALARQWRQEGLHRLTLTTTRESRLTALQPWGHRVLQLDAADTAALVLALEGAEAVVFCQAPTGSQLADREAYRRTYGTPFLALQRLLPALPQLRQIIYTGSGSVYGDAAGGWVDESTEPHPWDEHGAVLLEAEQALEACRGPERRVCVLRLGALYGPGRELLTRLAPLAGTTRAGAGASHTNWIHEADVVGAVQLALQVGWDSTVNLVDDEPIRLADLMDRITQAAGLPAVLWQPQLPDAPPRANRRVSNGRLKALGYELRHPRLQLPQLVALDAALFSRVCQRALASARLRSHHNLHRHEEPVQRFLNALQPGTYVRPHRHLRDGLGAGFECFVVVQGSIGLLVFDPGGAVIHSQRLDAQGPTRGLELAEGQFHSLVALSADAVLLELKQGPYQPLADKDFLADSPLEGTAAASALERQWRQLFEPTCS